jgi:hypothetical protein
LQRNQLISEEIFVDLIHFRAGLLFGFFSISN